MDSSALRDPTESLIPPRVLIVDDEKSSLDSIEAILSDLDVRVVSVESGEEALKQVDADRFAALLIDVQLPGIDGFETARRIRQLPIAIHTPIIFMTAYAFEPARMDEGYLLGAVDFLSKPFSPIALRAKVSGFLDLYQAREKALQEADQLRLLIQGTTEYAIFMLDPQGYVASWNSGAERIKGYRAEEIIGQHFSTFYPQEAIDRGWPTYELKVARQEGRFEDEGWRVRQDGSMFWANVMITALFDSEGVLRGFSKVTRDMTERRRSEELARRLIQEATARRVAEENAAIIEEQRERLHVTLASIGDAVISTDAQGRVTFLNSLAEELTGWRRTSAISQELTDVFQIINEKTRLPVENPAIRAVRDGVVVGLANHTILIARDGSERLIDDSAAPIRDSDGNVIGGVLVFRDITERQRSVDRMRFQARVLDAVGQAVVVTEPNGSIIYWNQFAETLYGWPAAEVMGKDAISLLVPSAGVEEATEIMNRVRGGESWSGEFTLQRRDNSSFSASITSTPVFDESGNLRAIIGICADITQRKRAEQSARFLADASATLAVLVDYESTLQKVASLAVPYFADWATVDMLEPDETLRRVAVAHIDPSKIELARELHRRFPPDPASDRGAWKVLRSGQAELVSEITDELLVKTVEDSNLLGILRELGLKSYMGVPVVVRGKPRGVLSFISAEAGYFYDAADLAIAEELAHRAAIAIENSELYRELREADRRKDEFLATLAHELRNPLAPIRNSLQILKMSHVDSDTSQRTREMMERQVHHLVRLVDDLLDVSRVMRGKIELRKEQIELASAVARAVETAQPLLEVQGHDLAITLPHESLLFDADLVRVSQVISNLLTNAAKYTEPNGRIELVARRVGQQAELCVRDNGIGIVPEMLPRIFDLFVQVDHATNRSQGGLGIGLTLVKNLVELHGGSVEAHSAGLGKGSEFVVRLPLIAPRPTSNGTESQGKPISVGHRILVVDDNKDAAASLAMLLKLQGHEVQTANSGRLAIELVRTFRPELLFLDIGMPEMDGYEVARYLRKLPEGEHLVLAALTGWGQQEDRRRSAEAGFDHHLVKPPEPKLIESIITGLRSV